MAEGAPLLRVYTLTRIEGSNPSLSAITKYREAKWMDQGCCSWSVRCFMRTLLLNDSLSWALVPVTTTQDDPEVE